MKAAAVYMGYSRVLPVSISLATVIPLKAVVVVSSSLVLVVYFYTCKIFVCAYIFIIIQ